MRYTIHRRDSCLLLHFDGRLDALEIADSFWSALRADLYQRVCEGIDHSCYIDLRSVAFADSRSVFHLRQLVRLLSDLVPVSYLGPGPGIERLRQLGESPRLAPMIERAPWESAAQASADLPVVLLPDVASAGTAPANAGALPDLGSQEIAKSLAATGPVYAATESGGTPIPPPGDPPGSEGKGSDEETFSIDLDMERLYLAGSTSEWEWVERAIPKPLEFHSALKPLEAGSETVSNRPTDSARELRIDPVALIRHAIAHAATAAATSQKPPAQDPESAKRKEQPAVAAPIRRTPEVASGAVPGAKRATAAAGTTRPESAPEIAAGAPIAAPLADRGDRERERMRDKRREQDMLLGVRKMLESVGSAERARRKERDRRRALERAHASLTRERDRALQDHEEMTALGERAAEAARSAPSRTAVPVLAGRAVSGAATGLPGSSLDWLSGLDAAPVDTTAHRADWEELLRAFHTRGAIDAKSVERLAVGLAEVAPQISARIALLLESPATGFAGDRWQATLLVLSTLLREGRARDEIRAALGNILIATLIEFAPGRRPLRGECLGGIEEQVTHLLAEGIVPSPGEAAPNVAHDIALWRSAVRIAAFERLGGDGWRLAIGAALSQLSEGAPEQSGIRRLIECHSLYLPGNWVELTTGGIGPVLGANAARPEMPHVLVLFRRHRDRCTPTAPILFPAASDVGSSILRVLRAPRILEEVPHIAGTSESTAKHPTAENVTARPQAGRDPEFNHDSVEGITA